MPERAALGDVISAHGWAKFAACAGFPAEDWDAQVVRHPLGRKGNALLHVTPQHADGPGYLLKVLCGETADRAGEQLAGHWAASRRLADHPHARVPALIGVLPEEDAILMDFVPGPTLGDCLAADTPVEDRIAAVVACARWLSFNHAAGKGRDTPIAVGTIGQRLHRLLRDAQAARADIGLADGFDDLAQLAKDAVARIPDCPMPLGARHGDANPGNFILQPEGAVYGLDLLRPVPQHICNDLAHLLVQAIPRLALDEGLPAVMDCLSAELELDAPMALATTACLRIEMLGIWRRLTPARIAAGGDMARLIKQIVDGAALESLRL